MRFMRLLLLQTLIIDSIVVSLNTIALLALLPRLQMRTHLTITIGNMSLVYAFQFWAGQGQEGQ